LEAGVGVMLTCAIITGATILHRHVPATVPTPNEA
jgi:hypothetical protein